MTSAVTILLVDEEHILRRATALLLADRGGQVSAVASIGEAISLTQKRDFDVAVIDIAPGGPCPAEVLQQLRERGRLPRRVVVCACPPVSSREAQPFTAVLQKPYVFEHLLAAVFGPRSLRRQPSRSGVFLSPHASAGHASRLPGKPREPEAARAVAAEPRRTASPASLRGLQRAARARRGRV